MKVNNKINIKCEKNTSFDCGFPILNTLTCYNLSLQNRHRSKYRGTSLTQTTNIQKQNRVRETLS